MLHRRSTLAAVFWSKHVFWSKMESSSGTGGVSLETLRFENEALKRLPLDGEERNFVRTVNNACFSRVKPTPLKNPQLVCYSSSALQLMDLTEHQIHRKEFVEYFAGNQILPGSETASHCYCGHQFGSFAGQLGDGASIYLGEIINKTNQRWELQLKGAGPTPYSRSADGRKVLRSSIREFLCSEAMHHLEIPTTRAGSCIVSDDTVERDIFYTGNPKDEKCAVISRIAPTFIRFGSFEIFKTMDPTTGRVGPSVGRTDILKTLLDYVVEMFYPDIATEADEKVRYQNFYKEVVIRTARLVALWQCVGFCHGVLNTDNMSIVGLTIDYGPYGFIDRYDPDHICNSSDNAGQYCFENQPDRCNWNLGKFAEVLKPLLPLEISEAIRKEWYYKEFDAVYYDRMRKKMGLLTKLDSDTGEVLSDKNLVREFHETMEKTGADFTNSFRALSHLSLPGHPDHESSLDSLREKLMQQCYSVEELRAGIETQLGVSNLQMFILLLQINPGMQEESKEMKTIVKRLQLLEKVKKSSQDEKKTEDSRLWNAWLDKYVKRLQFDVKEREEKSVPIEELQRKRVKTMNSNNPRFVLRNYIAQEAITRAEKGDYSEVWKVLKLLEEPYAENASVKKIIEECAKKPNIKPEVFSENLDYDKKPTINFCKLKVSCSS